MRKNIFTSIEVKFLFGISISMGFRQLAMSMVMPFISIYGVELTGSTPCLIGLSLGIFGLFQAIFQIPFGMLSDKIGRKYATLIGLAQLVVGLIIASVTTNIYWFIVARAFQGSGAIMAVIYSWVGDTISNHKKDRAMSIVSIVIGLAVASAFGLGPVLYKFISIPKMFFISAILISIGWVYIFLFIKTHKPNDCNGKSDIHKGISFLKNIDFIKFILIGLINNYLLMSIFYVIPLNIQKTLGVSNMWKVFFPATIIAIIIMKCLIKFCEKGYVKKIMMVSFLVIFISIFGLLNNNFESIILCITLFLSGYMSLVSIIPSIINKSASKNYRGIINGIFNTLQFLGSFLGAWITGCLWEKHKCITIVIMSIICILGIIIIKTLRNKSVEC